MKIFLTKKKKSLEKKLTTEEIEQAKEEVQELLHSNQKGGKK